MSTTTVTEPVRRIAVPARARRLSTLSRVDYADAFLMATGGHDRTPEAWARAVLEDAPVPMRRTLASGWSALGLKLGAAEGEDAILGWAVRARTPEHVLLGADSRVGMPGELLFCREGDDLLFCTFVRFGHPLARGVWAGVEPVHVRIVRQLLEQAGRRAAG